MRRIRSGGDVSESRWRLLGIVASVAVVVAVTALIQVLKEYVPVLSLGVLFVAAVLPIAVAWGAAYAIPVAVASMLAFNWFHLPPEHSFTLADSENWFALLVYLATAVVVSDLASRARRRAKEAEQREREAGLLADVSASLLGGEKLETQLDRIAARAAEVLGVSSARIELGPGRSPPAAEAPYPLTVDRRMVGTLYVPQRDEPDLAARQRFLPALALLLAVATDRDRLAQEALEAEALRRSDAVKTAVIQAVSHDLRTPLATMETALGGLESEALQLDAADRAALLETLRLELGRLKQLVENLLDLSRLEAGAAQPSPELWTADQLVAQAVEEVAASDRIDIVLGEGLPLASVDALQIQRVLVNLLDNALRLSPASQRVQVRVNATRTDLIFRVVDHGPGVPEGELEHIFEPFYRLSGTNNQRGAGLGLAIARRFALANGGRVWAESRPGQGATFALALPAVAIPVLAQP